MREPGNVRLAPDLDGGALMDVGCYCVNGSRFLAGEPESVFGTSVTEAAITTSTEMIVATAAIAQQPPAAAPAGKPQRRALPVASVFERLLGLAPDGRSPAAGDEFRLVLVGGS